MKSVSRRPAGPLCAAALVLQGIGTTAEAEGRWSGQIAATSDYVLRGVSQTDGHIAVQGSLAYRALSGVYAGAWASSLDRTDWYYPAGTAGLEIDLCESDRGLRQAESFCGGVSSICGDRDRQQ